VEGGAVMAHVAKYNKGAMGHMLSHYDRSKDNISGNIDPEKMKDNYNLASHQDKRQLDFIHERLSQVRVQNRKDVNVLCDWVVTAPKDLPAAEHKQFFKETYNFLENQYGKNNVISSYVHMDETTPHMHFAFIPVTEDKKRDGYKVSAKEAITRKDLKTFHGNLSKHLERKLSHEVNILNEATKEGNRSIDELKRQSARERLQEVTQEASKIVSKAQEQVREIETSLTPLKAEYEAKKAYIRECNEQSKVSMAIPDYAKVTEKGIFKKEEYVTVPKDKWIEKHVSANEKIYLEKATEAFEKTISKHKNVKQLEDKIDSLEESLKTIKFKNYTLKYKLESTEKKAETTEKNVKGKIKSVLRNLPDEVVNAFNKEWIAQDKALARKLSKSNQKGMDR